jgi:hypothetical protein
MDLTSEWSRMGNFFAKWPLFEASHIAPQAEAPRGLKTKPAASVALETPNERHGIPTHKICLDFSERPK